MLYAPDRAGPVLAAYRRGTMLYTLIGPVPAARRRATMLCALPGTGVWIAPTLRCRTPSSGRCRLRGALIEVGFAEKFPRRVRMWPNVSNGGGSKTVH